MRAMHKCRPPSDLVLSPRLNSGRLSGGRAWNVMSLFEVRDKRSGYLRDLRRCVNWMSALRQFQRSADLRERLDEWKWVQLLVVRSFPYTLTEFQPHDTLVNGSNLEDQWVSDSHSHSVVILPETAEYPSATNHPDI